MMSVDDVFDRIVSSIESRPATRVELLDAVGLVLTDDLVATGNLPPFNNSAMDGYAIHASETNAGLPARFETVANIAAGTRTMVAVGPGQAARIMTGASLPDGLDAVVRFEEVEETESGVIAIQREITVGENVRLAGEDVHTGATVLRRGTPVRAAEIGLLAATGWTTVPVHARPRIGIISTGDEVVEAGAILRPGQIRDANSYLLTAMVMELGAEPIRLGIAGDTRDDLRERFAAAQDCDLIVTSGGVSRGDFDLVKDVMRQEGQVDIWTVRMKPGKPLAYGSVGSIPILGLPGNPAAAAVAFHQFGRPAILKMLGHTRLRLPVVRARLVEAVENRGRRRHFERGIVNLRDGEWTVRPTGIHGSAMLTGLSAANCYIVVPEELSEAATGTVVDVQLFGMDVFESLA